MTPLRAEIAQRIERDGPLPVVEFMRLCLSHPDHGYYRRQPAIGASGDFITAPEISQVFGELLGLWAAEMWSAMGRPSPVHMIEMGPGRGTLMADALRAIGRVTPDFRRALAVHLVEVNPTLRAQQAQRLTDAAPAWHESFAEVPAGPAIVLANEFFDALPIRQWVRADDGWHERAVCVDGDQFVFCAGKLGTLPDEFAGEIGTVVERSPEGEALARAIATRIAAQGGAALLIDYGPLARGVGDTLQAVKAHTKVSPLTQPGQVDLTAHVDFQGLAEAARAGGAAAHGPVPQGRFLQRLGIAARTATLIRGATREQARDIADAVARLIDEAQMGTLFKALAIVERRLGVPPGFDSSDAT